MLITVFGLIINNTEVHKKIHKMFTYEKNKMIKTLK